MRSDSEEVSIWENIIPMEETALLIANSLERMYDEFRKMDVDI